MASFKLVDDGYPTFKKIMRGRDWVGRVCRHADGRYMGMIGKSMIVYADTEVGAFEQAVAQYLGYVDADALKARNARIRSHNREARRAGRYAAEQLMRGNFKPFDDLFLRARKGE